MKRVITICLAVLCMACVFSDPAEGFWKSLGRKKAVTGLWRFEVKDNVLYGTCVLAMKEPVDRILTKCKKNYKGYPLDIDLSTQRQIDVPLIYGVQKQSEGVWRDGHIIDARNGRLYTCHITFHPAGTENFKVDTLELRGEIELGIGMSQYWEPTTAKEINQFILANIEKYGSEETKKNKEKFLVR
ncbi:DUF2147 domain-containing protein [Treponema phagedenis]|uniref:DUF2147 domain-containing protein n=1 Tax=Treponema phagedenis TaxID=162 RepID=UPI0002F60095|nr:DUF2147 domain-containing protein [Treponema phagedenis]TYT77918.1 DUF2147 domain-containing protein [Treponema phagedenis]